MQDDAGSTKGKECTILDDATLAGLQLYITHKGAGIAVVVAERIAQVATLVTRNGDGAVVEVNAGVNSLESGIDGIALLVAANDIVAHLQGNDLLVVEHVFDNDNVTAGYS